MRNIFCKLLFLYKQHQTNFVPTCLPLISLAISSCHSWYIAKSSNIRFGLKVPTDNHQEMDELMPAPMIDPSNLLHDFKYRFPQRLLPNTLTKIAACRLLTRGGRGGTGGFPYKNISEAGLRLRARRWLTAQQRRGLQNPQSKGKISSKKTTARRKGPRESCSYDGK